MRRFQIIQSRRGTITSHSGLALVGAALNRHTRLDKQLVALDGPRTAVSTLDLIRSSVGLLCLGKNDFEAVDNVRGDRYFKQALGIIRQPSSARLRQRYDEDARKLVEILADTGCEMLQRLKAPVTPLACGYVPLDIDAFPMDNSNTVKEFVSRTYAQYDGYCPLAAYLGNEGWNIGLELRPGSWHGQLEFGYFLDRVLPRARVLAGGTPILCRLDSGHDAAENLLRLNQEKVGFIIKWNPRRNDPFDWLNRANALDKVVWTEPRDGKRVGLFSETVTVKWKNEQMACRRVIRITERTIDRNGQQLLIPNIRLEGWWTSLPESKQDDEGIIALYRDHATSEQFHSEFKTDLDLERLPSGKFDTNDLIMTLASLAYNILRWIGLIGLTGEVSPIRNAAKRRRLRTVIQELMTLACRLIKSGRRLVLAFDQHCPALPAFRLLYERLAYG